MLEAHLHQLRERVQPGDAVVHLEQRLAARLEHPAHLVHERLRIGRVLHDAVREHVVEGVAGKRQLFAVGDAQVAGQSLLLEVGLRQRDGRRREIDAGADGAALGEARQVDRGTAPDLEHRLAAIAVEIDQPQQVMQLFEVILVQILEEPARPDRVRRDFEIVDVLFPVRADFVDGRHAGYYIVSCLCPRPCRPPCAGIFTT